MTKRFGFTLAEVLITLGIIGVVAAMTIPTLVKNYQKTVWVNQLKKSVSTIENGFKMMMADDEVQLIGNTSLYNSFRLSNNRFFSILNDGCISSEDEEINKSCVAQKNTLKKYFNIVKDTVDFEGESEIKYFGYHYRFLNGKIEDDESEDTIKFYLADGSILGIYFDGWGDTCRPNMFIASVKIDVNGDKLPNQWGRDVFEFYLLNNGQLIPFGCKKGKELFNGNYWKDSDDCAGSAGSEGNLGRLCTARIIENGWKMDY